MKRCRVILAFEGYSVGAIITPPGVFRDYLRSNGYVEVLPDEPESQIPDVIEKIPEKRRGCPKGGWPSRVNRGVRVPELNAAREDAIV